MYEVYVEYDGRHFKFAAETIKQASQFAKEQMNIERNRKVTIFFEGEILFDFTEGWYGWEVDIRA